MKTLRATIAVEATEASLLEGLEGETLEGLKHEFDDMKDSMIADAPKGCKVTLTCEIIDVP